MVIWADYCRELNFLNIHIPIVVNKVDVKVIYVTGQEEVETNFPDFIIVSGITHVHLFVKGVYSGGSSKVYLLKTKVGKSIQAFD